MSTFEPTLTQVVDAFLKHGTELNAQYRSGAMHVHVPDVLLDGSHTLDELIPQTFPISTAAMTAAARSLFFSLPVAFDPAESVGPYLAIADRDATGAPYRFLDMGALIATQGFGEQDPAVTRAVIESLPFITSRYAHSEYQTTLSLRLKSELNRVAPDGTPRHFVVNTGAEAVENAIKAVLLNRVLTSENRDGGFIVSFEGAFHGRTLGALAVTHRKKARLGFPTFEWPRIPFPSEEPTAPKETLRREERSLKQLWDLLVSGRLPHADKSRDTYRREMEALDDFLAHPLPDTPERTGLVDAFVQSQRRQLSADVVQRSRRVAAVLVEPIQGEGGVRMASGRFMRKLRLLTRIYDVPLVFDEVQTGWGSTGRLWAHQLFDLPSPPDLVTWAKKAQNGVLFVSEALATFFQEEKKFNTTWEGDSVGMVRLLALLDKLDLEQVRRTGDRARQGLEALAKEYPDIVNRVRGAGVMLGFDVRRADLRDVLLDRAFRRGLLLLAAGERTVRVYPRYDTEPYAIDEALAILRQAIGDLIGRQPAAEPTSAVKFRVGTLAIPLDTVTLVDLSPANLDTYRAAILAVEQECYSAARYPGDVLRSGARPLLQFPAEALETTVSNTRAIALVATDRVSGRVIGYALGSALENHDEEGVASDPHLGDENTFYLQAMATTPSIQNSAELENYLLDALRERATAAGFQFLSTLIEDRLHETGPEWLRDATVLSRIDNYLRSGLRFVYLQASLAPVAAPAPQI